MQSHYPKLFKEGLLVIKAKMMKIFYSNYKPICEKIVQLNHKIRFVGIINDNGRLITGAVQNKIKFYVDKKDREMLFMEVALRTRMLGEFNSCLGPTNFSLHHREFLITMEFPIEDKTIFVSAEKELDLNEIPFKIKEILKEEILLYSIAQ